MFYDSVEILCDSDNGEFTSSISNDFFFLIQFIFFYCFSFRNKKVLHSSFVLCICEDIRSVHQTWPVQKMLRLLNLFLFSPLGIMFNSLSDFDVVCLWENMKFIIIILRQ